MSTEQAPRADRKKRRAVLLTIMALGAVVSLMAVNGVFAIFTDRATTGENSAASRGEARSADLQIASASFDSISGDITCGTFVDDLVSGLITATDMAPGGAFVHEYFCLKNVGSRSLDVTVSAIDLVDTDHDCTGDEAELDATCGSDLEGELSSQLGVQIASATCAGSATTPFPIATLTTMASTPQNAGTLGDGDEACYVVYVKDVATNTGDMITITQSDTSTWRFAFDGTAT